MEEALQKAISTIVSLIDPEKIILFGSMAMGAQHEASDIDLLVLKKGINNRRELTQKIYKNFSNIGCPVDILVENIDQYENRKNDPYLIYSEIMKNGKVVYERA